MEQELKKQAESLKQSKQSVQPADEKAAHEGRNSPPQEFTLVPSKQPVRIASAGIFNDTLPLLQYIEREGVNLDEVDQYGGTLLTRACASNDKEDGSVITSLLFNKANVNKPDKGNRTPLIWASFSGNQYAVKQLLNHRAHVDCADKNGRTALIYASKNGYRTILELLVRHHANVDNKDKDGRTALMHASRKGKIKTVQKLVELGADITVVDTKKKETAFQLADRYKRKAVKGYLEQELLEAKKFAEDNEKAKHDKDSLLDKLDNDKENEGFVLVKRHGPTDLSIVICAKA
jgi:ankyrin repeat protein